MVHSLANQLPALKYAHVNASALVGEAVSSTTPANFSGSISKRNIITGVDPASSSLPSADQIDTQNNSLTVEDYKFWV